MKNTARFFEILGAVDVPVVAKLYGPLSDKPYWTSCQGLIQGLPDNVVFEYGGVLPPSAVAHAFGTADLALFPTRNESFGHVVAEAIAVGCPVLTTRNTSWTDLLLEGCGDVFDTDQEAVDLISAVARQTPEHRLRVRRKVRLTYAAWRESVDPTRSLFSEAIDLSIANGAEGDRTPA